MTTGTGCTGRLLIKLVDAPKMSGRGSPRTGWLVVPTGMAKGIGVCKTRHSLPVEFCHNMWGSAVCVLTADCVGGAGWLTGCSLGEASGDAAGGVL